ncbi:Hsp20 family protein [Streptomyces sp. GLT-R25]
MCAPPQGCTASAWRNTWRTSPAPSGCSAGAQGDKATADYKDGVLTITVPVPVPETKAGTRTIPVRYV